MFSFLLLLHGKKYASWCCLRCFMSQGTPSGAEECFPLESLLLSAQFELNGYPLGQNYVHEM